jgi:transcription antitermination factor NusG
VLKLVKFGDAPAHCPDAEIDRLKAMIVGGFVRLPDRPPKPVRRVFRKGDPLKIIGGPLQGAAALHTGLSAAEKEILLVSMLGAQRRIAVPAYQVAAQ